MRFIAIQEIRFEPGTNDLRLVPGLAPGEDYDGVYRAAMSARWDEASGELFTVDFIGRTPLASYKQIVGAVADEYHDYLTPTAGTAWIDVPANLRGWIEAWHADEPASA